MYDYHPWFMMRKLRVPKNKQLVAAVTMSGTLDFNPAPPWNPVGEIYYYVYAWVHPNYTESHYLTVPSHYPIWRGKLTVPVGLNQLYDYLHVEVCRTMDDSETGPSCLEMLVGRTRVKLPKIGGNICGTYELVRLDPEGSGMVLAGEIRLSIEVVSYSINQRYN